VQGVAEQFRGEGRDVVLAVSVAADCRDLVGLDDQVRFEACDGLSRLLGGGLIGIADRNEGCQNRISY